MTKRLRSFICVVQLPAHPRVKFFGFGANNEVDAAVLGREHAAQLHPGAAVLGIATQEDVTGMSMVLTSLTTAIVARSDLL